MATRKAKPATEPAPAPAPAKRTRKASAPAPVPAEPAPAPVAAPAPTKRARKAAAPAEPPPMPTLPLGVYCDHNRHTAIVIKRAPGCIWYLTMITEQITVEAVGEERFKHLFPLAIPDYPMRNAVRKYFTSLLRRDDTAQKVMKVLLERL